MRMPSAPILSMVWLSLSMLMSLAVSFAAGESIKADHVNVSWVAPEAFGAKSETIGIRFQMDPEWHVYWKNPGDSGAAPKFQFTSDSADLGEIEWPVPHRLTVGDLTNLGYDHDVVFPLSVKPKTNGDVSIRVKLEWLVCKEECIPGFGELELKRPQANEAKWNQAALAKLNEFTSRVPRSKPPFESKLESTPGGQYLLKLATTTAEAPELFPVNGELVKPAAPKVAKTQNGYEYTFEKVPGTSTPSSLAFVIAAGKDVYEVSDLSVSAPPPQPVEAGSLLLLLGAAFLGGVLLNLMPCVFPVLSIKVFSLARQSSSPTKEGLLYSLGTIVTFAALGVAFLALRSAGSAVGWGFQLQSPLVILGLILLFWLMALNFLGVFEFGERVMNIAGQTQSKPKAQSSFFTGVLSVFVAAPCTGPFMGTALGATATLPGAAALLIFVALGAGLAFPFLLLAIFPKAMSVLPKPGAWMERFKQFLAFPLFATVLWLLWVLGKQIGDTGWIIGASLCLAIAFCLWLGKGARRAGQATAWALAVAAVFICANVARTSEKVGAASKEVSSTWRAFDEAQIQAARAEKRAVFIDYTAAWCITCQWNKKSVLETEKAQELFRSTNTYAVRADWTNYDPRITASLAALGRSSVPVYAFYSADGAPVQLLPQILTISMIEDLFKNVQPGSIQAKETSQ